MAMTLTSLEVLEGGIVDRESRPSSLRLCFLPFFFLLRHGRSFDHFCASLRFFTLFNRQRQLLLLSHSQQQSTHKAACLQGQLSRI